MEFNLSKINENFNFENIEYSIKDTKRKITIPETSNEILAELIGILMGDGHLGIYAVKQRKNKICRYELNLSGHLEEDRQYYKYVNKQFKLLFNVSLNIKEWKVRNALVVTIGSKAILTFFKTIGFPIGNKNDNGSIPSLIKKGSKKEKFAFLRGVADTDFSLTFKSRKKTLHSYPVIKGSFKSYKLISDLKEILNDLNLHFTYCIESSFDKRFDKYLTKHVVYIRGRKNLFNWMKDIGFKNPKHLTKYNIWKKFGFCPPYTSLSERLRILNGEISPFDYY